MESRLQTGDAVPSMETWRGGIRLALRLVTAHHPLCSWFRDDVHQIGAMKVCRGCAAAWPMMLLGLAAAVLVLLSRLPLWPVGTAIGLLLGLPHGTTYLHRFGPRYRAFAKLSGGFGLGLLIPSLLVMPLPPWVRYGLLGVLGVAFLLLQLVRMRRILATCDACPWRRDWARCPGFAPYAEQAPKHA